MCASACLASLTFDQTSTCLLLSSDIACLLASWSNWERLTLSSSFEIVSVELISVSSSVRRLAVLPLLFPHCHPFYFFSWLFSLCRQQQESCSLEYLLFHFSKTPTVSPFLLVILLFVFRLPLLFLVSLCLFRICSRDLKATTRRRWKKRQRR